MQANIENNVADNTGVEDTSIDNSVEQQYNDPQEELQRRYYEALESGDDDKITKVEQEIHNYLGGTKEQAPKPEETPPAQEAPGETAEKQSTPNKEEATTAKDGGTSPQTEEWLESLDPKVREIVLERLNNERKAREYHEQKYRSDIGRITAYKDKYENERKAREQLEAKLKEQVSQPAQVPAQSDNRSSAQVASDNAKLKALNEQISSIRKNGDDELASSLETLRDAFLEEIGNRAKTAPAQPAIDPSLLKFKEEFEQQKFEFHVERERHRLEQMVPGAIAILDYVDQRGWSPWQEFVSTLPPTLQRAADDANADTYAYLMPLYGQWAERYNAAHGYTQQPSNEQPKEQPAADIDPRAAQTTASRQSKVVTSPAAAPVKSSPPPAGREPTVEDLIQSANGLHPQSPEYLAIQEKIYKIMERDARKGR